MLTDRGRAPANGAALEPDEDELDSDLDDDAELGGDLILDDQERSDFAQDDLPEPDDELGPWDWVTD